MSRNISGDRTFTDNIGVHIELAAFSAEYNEEEINPGYLKDDYGVVWNRTAQTKTSEL